MKQNIIKNGIIAGVATIGYVLLFYYTSKESLFTATFTFSSILIYIAFMYMAAIKEAKSEFKTVLRAAFGVFVVANVIYYAFDYTLFNYIDKTLEELQKDVMIQYYAERAKDATEQNLIRQGIIDGQFHSLKGTFFSFAKGAIGGFGLSVLITYLIKRRES